MIRTGGARFDSAAPPIYFAAAGATLQIGQNLPQCILIAVNDLTTDSQERRMAELLDAGWTVLLDSGIFWLTNQHMRAVGCTMDQALALPPEQINGFTELFDHYVRLVRRYEHQLWGYIELDQGGMANKKRTRARLHDLGFNPMPVYHPLNDGYSYFDELAQGYDRICLGNIVQASPATRLRLLHTMWERHCAYPDLWVHVLGLTVSPQCLTVPPDSCDSSVWLGPLRWNHVAPESTMLRPLFMMAREWRATSSDETGTPLHFQTYAQTVTHMNQMWDDILDVHTSIGAEHYPSSNPVPRRPQVKA